MEKKRKYSKELWKTVNARDGGKCKNPSCFYTGSKTNQHHIYDWSTYPEKRFDKDNLITLCSTRRVFLFFKIIGCHQRLHKWNGGTRVSCDESTLKGFFASDMDESTSTLRDIIFYFAVFALSFYVSHSFLWLMFSTP